MCGKIGFLPYGLRHIGLKDMAAIYEHKLMTPSLSLHFLDLTGFEGKATS